MVRFTTTCPINRLETMINCRAGRKTVIICCLVTLSLGLVLDRAEASVSFSVQNSGSNCVTASPSIIIREGAGGNYDKVASVPYGEQVRITNSAGGYSEITTNGGINGWASTSFFGVCENVISDDRLKTETEMRDELAVAGYPFAGTAPLAEIERVYAQTAVGHSPTAGTSTSESTVLTSTYKPADGRMFTAWAAGVSEFDVHPEYPRPQMTRSNWLNLNGLWQYKTASNGDKPPLGQDLEERILVPFPIEAPLSGIMRHVDHAWYRRTVDIPDAWNNQRVLLHFGAVDWQAHVYVNGQDVGTHRGGYDPFSIDITEALKPVGAQEIIVGVFDPTDSGEQPRGKQVHNPTDIWYTAATGIWQTVWLEPVPLTHIEILMITPDVDQWSVRVAAEVSDSSNDVTVHAEIIDQGQVIATGYGPPDSDLVISISNPRLWSPSNPYLYDLRVRLIRQGRYIDTVGSYFGMRKIEVSTDEGVSRLKINGETLFQMGVLDQGYWPDGLYTAPTDQALKYDIEATKWLGYNLIRKHMKVEPDRWYYWADRLGILVWQDMPMGNNWGQWGQNVYQDELQRMIKSLYNHPSIIVWVLFNEHWGQFNTHNITDLAKKMDPSRLVIGSTGYAEPYVGDLVSFHSYGKVDFPPILTDQAKVLAEWGGLGLPISGHTWSSGEFRWAQPAHIEYTTDQSQFLYLYQDYVNQIRVMRDTIGLSAAIYSQLTDVERETTGLLTYDRAALKVDVNQLSTINSSLY